MVVEGDDTDMFRMYWASGRYVYVCTNWDRYGYNDGKSNVEARVRRVRRRDAQLTRSGLNQLLHFSNAHSNFITYTAPSSCPSLPSKVFWLRFASWYKWWRRWATRRWRELFYQVMLCCWSYCVSDISSSGTRNQSCQIYILYLSRKRRIAFGVIAYFIRNAVVFTWTSLRSSGTLVSGKPPLHFPHSPLFTCRRYPRWMDKNKLI